MPWIHPTAFPLRDQVDAATVQMTAWATLKSLVGVSMPVDALVGNIAALDRNQTLRTLARIAGDLANSDGGALGHEARKWTHDLLRQRQNAGHPLEQAISRAVAELSDETPIAHAHVVYALQLHAIVHGTKGIAAHDGYLAFMMLAMNDYIPEWPTPPPRMTKVEDVVASMFFCSIFNRSDDPLRFVVRLVDMMAAAPSEVSGVSWDDIEHAAFGTSFEEYATAFLVPEAVNKFETPAVMRLVTNSNRGRWVDVDG